MPLNHRFAAVLVTCGLFSATFGISEVRAQSSGSPPTIALQLVPNATGLEHIEFSSTNSIAWVGDSALALIDVHQGEVSIHDIFSGQVRSTGGSGQGPGEMLWPVKLFVDGTALLVADSRNQRMNLFDLTTGKFRRSQRIQGMSLGIFGLHDSVAVFAWMNFMVGGPTIGSLDLTTGELDPWFEVLQADERFAELGNRFLALTSDGHGHYYAGSGREYRIVVFDSLGAPVDTLLRPGVEPSMPTESAVERHRAKIEDVLASSGATMPAAVMETVIDKFRTQPVPFFLATAFAVGPSGGLWVINSPRGADSTSIDLFDASGEFQQTLRVRDRAYGLAINDSLVAVLVERASGDWEDLRSVDFYRIIGQADE